MRLKKVIKTMLISVIGFTLFVCTFDNYTILSAKNLKQKISFTNYYENVSFNGIEVAKVKVNKEEFDKKVQKELNKRNKKNQDEIKTTYIIIPPTSSPNIDITGSTYYKIVNISDEDNDIISRSYSYNQGSYITFTSNNMAFGIPGSYNIRVQDNFDTVIESFTIEEMSPESADIFYDGIDYYAPFTIKTIGITSTIDLSYSTHTMEAYFNKNTRYIDLHSQLIWVVPPVYRLNDIMLIGYDEQFKLSNSEGSHSTWSVGATQKVDYITREYVPCTNNCDMGDYILISQSTWNTGYQEINKDNIIGGSGDGLPVDTYTMYMRPDLPNDIYYYDPVTLYPTNLLAYEVTRIEYNMYVGIVTYDYEQPTLAQLEDYLVYADYIHTYQQLNLSIQLTFGVSIDADGISGGIDISIAPNITTSHDQGRGTAIYVHQ
jgi:hypothetical protein